MMSRNTFDAVVEFAEIFDLIYEPKYQISDFNIKNKSSTLHQPRRHIRLLLDQLIENEQKKILMFSKYFTKPVQWISQYN